MNNTLDLRQSGILNLLANHNVIYPLTFQNIVNLDTNYIMSFNNGVTYQVGSGITISGSTVTVLLDTAQFANNQSYIGSFKSASRTAGVYMNIVINLTINDGR
jgi:hypothetical protein